MDIELKEEKTENFPAENKRWRLQFYIKNNSTELYDYIEATSKTEAKKKLKEKHNVDKITSITEE